MQKMTVTQMFAQSRSRGVPIVAVNTTDPQATIEQFVATLDDHEPAVSWDMQTGFVGVNKPGIKQVQKIQTEDMPFREATLALREALKFAQETVIFWHGIGYIFDLPKSEKTAPVVQGVWNLRSPFKASGRTAVLMGTQVQLPKELENDVLVIDEPLPDSDQLSAIIQTCLENVLATNPNYPLPNDEQMNRAIDAIRGLNAFAAEQSVALSMRKGGIDLELLWQHKREKIKQTPGLSVWTGEEDYSHIGGCDEIKGFLTDLINGPEAPKCVVFVDEIEKAMAGATTGDTSGVSQEMHGSLLSWMQDHNVAGVLLIGFPGSGKSEIAKATGREAGLLEVVCDFSSMKGQYVGESNGNLRRALKVIEAVSDNRILMIATCNGIASLSPELLRRFDYGQYFFDMPTPEEREKIWQIHGERRGVDVSEAGNEFSDDGWTGANIASCCKFAWSLGKTVKQAATRIIPFGVKNRQRVAALRAEASGNYLSAAHPGAYIQPADAEPDDCETTPQTGRKFKIGEN